MKFYQLLGMSIILVMATPTAVVAENPMSSGSSVLLVHDGQKNYTSPFLQRFRASFAETGIEYDELTCDQLVGKDLTQYDRIVVYAMVMAFNTSSPVRKWMKDAEGINGKKLFLFVTGHNAFEKDLKAQLRAAAEDHGAIVVDAVSAATKKLTEAEKDDLVRLQVQRVK